MIKKINYNKEQYLNQNISNYKILYEVFKLQPLKILIQENFKFSKRYLQV